MRPPQVRVQHELVVDSFAGGGGASTGLEAALGRPVDIAINHSPEAIEMHRRNHPETRHYLEDVWRVDPVEACKGRPVGLAWFSPDCKHFSRAKGAAPVQKRIRGLAWVVIRWAAAVRPRVIILENVEEFQTWGPLIEGRPDPARAGQTFRAWVRKLTSLGYWVEFRSLVAADYGAPTTRRRLFMIARCDGDPVVWPEPTHGVGRPRPWVAASEIIDWSLPCPSIFERKRPLAEATLRRIAAGIQRYVIGASEPFIIKYHGGRDWRGQSLDEPVHTVDGSNRYALVTPSLISHYGQSVGRDIRGPLPTVTAGGGGHQGLVVPHITKFYGGVVGHGVERPLGTVTAWDHHGLVSAFVTKFYGTAVGSSMQQPVPTVTAGAGGGHLGEVRAFMVKYYGAASGQHQGLTYPIHTVTSKARFGLVTVHGEDFEIVDIGMRMLSPRELFDAQGFPSDYIIDGLTKTSQISLCGNSVCPPVARELARSNMTGQRSQVA